MIKGFLKWLLSFFKADTVREKEAQRNVKALEKKLEDIKNEEYTDFDITDYLNK